MTAPFLLAKPYVPPVPGHPEMGAIMAADDYGQAATLAKSPRSKPPYRSVKLTRCRAYEDVKGPDREPEWIGARIAAVRATRRAQ